MLVGSVTESGKSMSLPDQAKLPVSQDTAQRDEDTKNGSIPISISLVIALAESLVCSVENTRCPVRDA